jgi:hypothetical protein
MAATSTSKRALFAPSDGDIAWRKHRLQHLSRLADQWRELGEMPQEVLVLSSGERIAVRLAARTYAELRDPLQAFFSINPFLQRWVLEQINREDLIGVQSISPGPSANL